MNQDKIRRDLSVFGAIIGMKIICESCLIGRYRYENNKMRTAKENFTRSLGSIKRYDVK
ncbi:MAG: hypothetical protein LBP89_07520 [Helicobacteraceae bacterium]|jgi:hypothetical protein|nr:hypothetical protein [Helicobacteraceae bacterium]